MSIWRLAWRNLWRNARRSSVTIGAMTFAFWVMILYSGLVEGYLTGMERDVLDLEVGDVQVFAAAYQDNPSIFETITQPDTILDQLEAKGISASPRLLAGGLGASGDNAAGVSLRGIDLARDRNVLLIGEAVVQGEWLAADDPKGVVLGRGLARALSADVGSELVVLSQGADGSMANDLFTVRGVLGPVSGATDPSAVFMADSMFRELMTLESGVHQIIVKRPETMELDDLASIVAAVAVGQDVRTWKKIMPMVATMLESSRVMISVIFFIIYLAVAILILNAVLMAVFERIKEFGVMKAIGYGPGIVMGMILAESAIQAALAATIGIVLSVPATWYMSNIGIDVGSLGGASVMGLAMKQRWYGIYDASSYLIPLVMMVVLTMLATLYPAIKAARIPPVEAMRHQ